MRKLLITLGIIFFVLLSSLSFAASLTVNKLIKYAGGQLTADSQIYDNGTNVGLGTASPSANLDVNGDGLFKKLNTWVIIDGVRYARTSAGINSALGAYGPGTTFFLTDGTYDVTTQINIWNADTSIVGSRNAVLKLHDATPNISIIALQAARQKLSGFTVDGNSTNQTGTSNWANIAIASGGTNASIESMYVINSNDSAISVSGANSRIVNNILINNVSSAMQSSARGAIYLGAGNIYVAGNYIENSPTGIASITTGAKNCIITGNTFNNITLDQSSAIHMLNTDANVITNNVIVSTALSSHGVNGIFVSGGSPYNRSIIAHNRMENVSGVGIEFGGTDAIIQGNWIRLRNNGGGTSTDQQGIFLGGGTRSIDLVDNFIYGSINDGIDIGYSSGGNKGMRIAGNTIAASGANGIGFNHHSGTVSNILFADNMIYDNTGYAIGNVAGGTLSDLRIGQNYFNNNGSGDFHSSVAAAVGNTYLGKNVGIGTSAPQQALDVSGDIYAQAGLWLGGTRYTSFAGSQWNGTNPIYSNVNVGLGTSAPQQVLDVAGDIYAQSGIWLGGTRYTSMGGGQWTGSNPIYFNGNVGIGSSSPRGALDLGSGAIYGNGSNLTGVSGSISGLTAGKLPKAGSSTTIVDSLIYDNGTRVGIGTTAPTTGVLSIGANGTVIDATGIIQMEGSTNTNFTKDTLYMYGYTPTIANYNATSGSAMTIIGSSVTNGSLKLQSTRGSGTMTDKITFFTGNSGSSERMRITTAGNVGIGTNAPQQMLEVDGGIYPRGGNYYSSDGTVGATVTTCTGFKNGLCISGT